MDNIIAPLTIRSMEATETGWFVEVMDYEHAFRGVTWLALDLNGVIESCDRAADDLVGFHAQQIQEDDPYLWVMER